MTTTDRTPTIWLTALSVLMPVAAAQAAQAEPAGKAAKRPNIVLIVSDDQGYNDIGIQGCKDIPTPNMDAFARGGVRFTNGYVSCPVCAPTRAGLMTGRYQQRFGFEFNPGPEGQASERYGLPVTEKTIAERLKPTGYVTGMVGKWHLGFKAGMQPPQRGFDEFFGFLAGARQYLPGRRAAVAPILRGQEPVDEKEYLTDAFKREALSFIDRHKTDTFFLYVPFNAVHGPLQATNKYLKRFDGISDENRRIHAAMLSALDDAVGEIMAKLRDSGLEENTLVFYLSDNGGPTRQTTSSNKPLRGFKGDVFEGGIRVPFMVSWKGRLPAGKVYDHPVISLDIHPTILAAAGVEPATNARLDGVNLLPYLKGEKTERPHDTLFWRFGNQWAVRSGDWKLLKAGKDEDPMLFNLKDDIGEESDLAAKEPERVSTLRGVYEEWNKHLASPKWEGGGRRPAAQGRPRNR